MQSKPKRQKTLYLLKGNRFSDAHPILSADIALRNARRNVETCLMLDLNVLADMEDVVYGKSTLKETGLDKAISILNSVPQLVLVPGFGLSESSTSHLTSRLASYEAFIRTYCPTYRDTPNSTLGTLADRLKSGIVFRSFSELPDSEKFVYAPLYATVLKLKLLSLENSRLPIEKFFDVLRFQCDDLDYLTLIPLELAKYVFCKIGDIRHTSFREFCANVRRIILKGNPKSSLEMRKTCLNATYDLFYYLVSCAGSSPFLEVNGQRQDLWILTGGLGLACFADAIYYDAAFPAMMAHRYGHVPHRNDYTYFRQCDRLVEGMGKKRRLSGAGKSNYEEIVIRSFNAIASCEHQVNTLFD